MFPEIDIAEWASRSAVEAVRVGDRELVAAMAEAEAAIAACPCDPAGFYLRGVVHQSRGHRGAALADFAAVVRLDPRHSRGWLMLSEVLAAAGEYDRARAARAEAVRLDSTVG